MSVSLKQIDSASAQKQPFCNYFAPEIILKIIRISLPKMVNLIMIELDSLKCCIFIVPPLHGAGY